MDTAHHDEWRSTISAAEAATEVGAEQDTTGDGGMIGRLLIALTLVFACLGVVHLISRMPS